MPFMPNRYKLKTATKKEPSSKEVKKPVVKAIKAVVDRTLDRKVEDKHIGWTVDNNAHNSPIGTADCYPLIQLIPKGTDEFNRIGSKIRVKSLVVRGTIGLDATQLDSRPIYARMIIASEKDVKIATSTNSTVDAAHLLRTGTPTADEVAFTGRLIELNYPVNTNKFNVYADRVVKLCPVITTGLVGQVSLEQRTRQTYRFSIKVKCPKTLLFDNGNGDAPNNFAPFFALGYCYQDNSSPDITTTRVFAEVSSMLTYEDA